MTRIICDTMIWYNLSKNKLQVPDPKQYKLVCTYLSLMELAFTPNSFNNLDEIQETIKCIIELKPELIMHDPTSYAKAIIDPDFNYEYEKEEDIVTGFLKVLLNHPKEGLLKNEFKVQLANISSTRKEKGSEWADFLNDCYKGSKEISYILKKYSTDADDRKKIRKWFVLQLNQTSKINYSLEQIRWEHFEFYEKVGARYMRNMYLTKMKADRNDENDLKNMFYVQPTDKYWTLEKRWLQMVKEIKFDRYLYVQPSTI
jgi:hypothetical protein